MSSSPAAPPRARARAGAGRGQLTGEPLEALPTTLVNVATATANEPDELVLPAAALPVASAPRLAARPAANLESAGQSSRMRLGIGALAFALGLVLALEALEAPRLYRLVLFAPFFLALFGATQALYRTCPGLAARGVREVCGTEEPVARASERQRNLQLGHRVIALSTLGALAATAIFVFLP